LYVLVTSEEPKVLIIDEPQSFLNPGALRKLLEVLTEHPEHQYILATHSPSLLSTVEIATLTLVKKVGTESKLIPLDPKAPEQLQLVLSEVGAQMSDIFGADRVLWVEGPTEEKCLPFIARKFFGALTGTVILGVKNTGDFEGKNKLKAEMAFDVYGKLSLEKPLLPPAIGFIFDREGRNDAQQKELKTRGSTSGVPVFFLQRRLYENYLLEPRAIAEVFNNYDNQDRPEPLTEEQVSTWIDQNLWDTRFFDNKEVPESKRQHEKWIRDVHAAKMLEKMFSDLSDTRIEYNKTTHSVDLTKWLLEHKSEALTDIEPIWYLEG
jgi:hypothetical protein